MLRPRDFAAALAIFVLAKLASDDPSDSLSANVQLSFYVGREHSVSNGQLHRIALAPVVLDVDGDGTAEALASVLHDEKSDGWQVQVLDLKPAASTDKTHMAPFRPKTLYQSEPLNLQPGQQLTKDSAIMPIKLATGHVLLQRNGASQKKAPLTMTHYKNSELNDRNRHYFCGNDWHHAAQQCAVPCPEGTAAECPDDQHCYADTPCDIADIHRQESGNKDDLSLSINDLLVTPAGGLPSVFSLWSNGALVMHSLTGDFPSNATTKTIKRSKVKELIGIRRMWDTSVVPNKEILPTEWSGVSLTYVDGTDAGIQSGIVVVQALLIYKRPGDDDDASQEGRITMAFEAETGKTVWDASLNSGNDNKEKEKLPLPLVSSLQSSARRRSLKPHVNEKKNLAADSNCLHAYRRSILTSSDILPYMYWSEADASTTALHFEQQQHNSHAIQAKKKRKALGSSGSASNTVGSTEAKKLSWKRVFSRRSRRAKAQPQRGKPNVIATKSETGIEVRSLKNGRAVCHLSLWEETLYSDLNHDGVLDAIFALTGDHLIQNDDKYEDNKWISKMVSRLKESKMLADDSTENEKTDAQLEDQAERLCHLMALSGVPPKEELFSVNLCGNNPKDYGDTLDFAPLLAVETLYGKGNDVVVALNDQTVQRFRGKNGRRSWILNGNSYDEFPTWEDGYLTTFDRINTRGVAESARPMLLVGDKSMALISPGHGKVLSTASIPQPSISRPILVDFNGDGTTDVMVVTQDAVWGYRVTVHAGSSIPFRIVVGLIVVGIMLAILRNRFGPHPGKRSTDA